MKPDLILLKISIFKQITRHRGQNVLNAMIKSIKINFKAAESLEASGKLG